MIVIRIRIQSKEGQADALAEIINNESTKVRQQAGCVMFELFGSAEDETAFLLYEEWQDKASFEAYKTSEPFGAIGAALPPLLAGKPDSAYYEGEVFFDA